MRLVKNQRVLGGDQSEGYVKGPHATTLVKSLGKALFRHHRTKSGGRRRRHPDFVPNIPVILLRRSDFLPILAWVEPLNEEINFSALLLFFSKLQTLLIAKFLEI